MRMDQEREWISFDDAGTNLRAETVIDGTAR
jgi:hypothetical protein